ncbi:MAG: tRNA pseudouridine(55) synthase TruB [Planctomycetota bacterium]
METTPPSGYFNVRKPAGITSRDLVNEVQRHIRTDTGFRKLKLGHTGTLDPLATGVMVLVVGTATRLTPWMLLHPKRYRGRFRLGQSSPSGDLETPVQHDPRPLPSRDVLEAVLPQFLGTIRQQPPAHSAIKIDGQRAHKRQRRGEVVNVPERSVRIDHITLESFQATEFVIDVGCGSGTYLRTLGKDIAEAADSTAVMTQLERTAVGPFAVGDAVCLPSLSNGSQWREHLLPIETGLNHLRHLTVSAEDALRLKNGLPIDADDKHGASFNPRNQTRPSAINQDVSTSDVLAVTQEGRAIAILREGTRAKESMDAGWSRRVRFRPHRVFPSDA